MKLICLCLAAGLAAGPAAAQETIFAPAGSVPKQATTFDDGTGKAATVSAAAPLPVGDRGTGSVATGQVAVGTTATLVAPARPGRRRVMVSVGAANACAFGNAGVTATTGFALAAAAGASVTLDFAGALYGACSASTTVSFIEQF